MNQIEPDRCRGEKYPVDWADRDNARQIRQADNGDPRCEMAPLKICIIRTSNGWNQTEILITKG